MEPMENVVSMTRQQSDAHDCSIDTCVATPCVQAEDNDVVTPLKEPLEAYYSKDLRKEVYRLRLIVKRKGPGANDHKTGYMALLREYWRANPPVAPPDEKPPKEQDDDQRLKGLPHLRPRLEPPKTPWTIPSDDTTSAPSTNATSSLPELSPCGSSNTEHEASADAQDLEETVPDLSLLEDKVAKNEDVQSSSEGNLFECDGISMEEDEIAHGVEEAASTCSITDDRSLQGASPPCLEKLSEDFKADVSVNIPAPDVLPCVVGESQATSDDYQSIEDVATHTLYWERRLVVSKRRIVELYGELQATVAQDEADLLNDELAYYTRERKRALKSLLSDTSTK